MSALTTQHLEELLRLALQENEVLRQAARNAKGWLATEAAERERLQKEARANAGRIYMDPDERTALARDLAEAHVTLGLAAETLRRRNQGESNRCERLFNRMGAWVKKLKVST